MLRLKSLTQTCTACPSQWEGARYRWGHLAVTAAPTMDRAVMALAADDEVAVLADVQLGDGMDGLLHEDDMLRRAGLTR